MISESLVYHTLLVGWFLLAAVVVIVLWFVSAPYGRHIRRGWGITMPSRLAWIVMESPAPLVFALCMALGEWRSPMSWVFLTLWEAHYVHRAFIYPYERRDQGKRMPAAIAGMGFFFNVVDGYLNGRYIFTFSGGYPVSWLLDPRFLAGLLLFIAGFVVNRHADRALRRLRRAGETGYQVPYGGLYRWVSCPNYLGEIAEWTGWAIASWSWPGLAFAVWTAANLVPRARAHHLWYREHFPDYPRERRALLPGLW